MDKSKNTIQQMFSRVAKCYDLANSVLSLGLHFLWKRILVNRLIEHKDQSLVLDLCSGTGDIQQSLRRRSINSIAADFTFPMLQVQSLKQNCSDRLLQADALNLPFKDQTFSIIAVSYGVRNFEVLETGLNEISRVLKNNGKLFILEFGDPKPGLMGSCVKTYEKYIVPLVGKFFFRNPLAYSYLSQSAKTFPSREEFIAIAQKSGFSTGEFRELFFGASYLYEITK